jgi:hypothetical protein
VIRGADGRISRIRYVMPRHKAANWVGPGRSRKSTQPAANGAAAIDLASGEATVALPLVPGPARPLPDGRVFWPGRLQNEPSGAPR